MSDVPAQVKVHELKKLLEAKDKEIERLTAALQKIASYDPMLNEAQMAVVAEAALKGED